MILVTGATGRTGQALVDRIVAERILARALVRDPAKAGALRERGLEVVVGALGDDAALARALDGIERALLLTSNAEEQWSLERRFIEMADAARVPHVVKLSAIGADAEAGAVLKRYHGLAEDRLRQSRLTHTIVQANFYMDNLLNLAPGIAARGIFELPMGQGRVGAVDIRDVADSLFVALTQPGHENRSYLVTGPGLLSFDDMASILSDVLGRDIRYADIAPQAFRERMISAGLPAWNIEAMLQLFALIREDRNACVTGALTELTGNPARTFQEFVLDHASRFR